MAVREIHITGLFGLYNHSITLRTDVPVTIVAGPNGVGKTTLLSLAKALLNGNLSELVKHEFTRLWVVLDDSVTIAVRPGRHAASRAEVVLSFEFQDGDTRPVRDRVSVAALLSDADLPYYIVPVGRGQYFDRRAGEYLTADEVIERLDRPRDAVYRGRVRGGHIRRHDLPEWYRTDEWKIDLIETKRLDTVISRVVHQGRRTERFTAPINNYLAKVRQTLEEARRDSTAIRQSRDRSFVPRSLRRARGTLREDKLRERYRRVETLAEELRENGLLTDALEVLPSGRLSAGDKRIVNLFLDDFEAKLAPLLPVSEKIERLRTVVGQKFLNKSIAVHPDRGLVFLAAPKRQEISPDALSSGEQHALALISRLLFSEDPGTTVLIDEPELSLHVSWQHEMVDDLVEIARVANLRFVLATHSTAIINNRWELVEELGPIEKK